MSCLHGHDDYNHTDHVTHADGRHTRNGTGNTVNGFTCASAAEPIPPGPAQRVGLHLCPAISHIDFWPSCIERALYACDAIFETFDILVERANGWLQQFPNYELINCETTDKKVHTVQDIYNASMAYKDESTGVNIATHVKGLRLWYRERRSKSSHSLALDFLDAVPRYINPGEKYPKFETLPDVIAKINEQLNEYPLQGRVLNIETVVMKIAEQEFHAHYTLNPLVCQCLDEYFTHQISFVRVFFRIGPPTFEVVGVKDFLPETLNSGRFFNPTQYSPFTSLIDRARSWINQSRGIRIANLQTLETKHCKKSEAGSGGRFQTERLFEYQIENRFRAYFLRVGYVQPTDSSLCLVGNPPPDLACRSFLPKLKPGLKYENITEVLERADRCINCTGANPIQAETVSIPEWMTRHEFSEMGDRTFYDGDWFFESDKDGNSKGPYRHSQVYAIRIYFDGDFQDPAFMTEAPLQVPDRSCCKVM